jgi:hypothetical protein
MRLGDIHHQKRGTVFVLFVELIESGNLPPKRRSSVTAEHQHHRLILIQSGELNMRTFVQLKQRKIRSLISSM